MVEKRILLNPGPATTTDSVKNAQVVPDICPREKEFGDLMKSISRNLIKIAGGDENYTCVLFGGSGTAGVEAIINSVSPQKKKILIINNGAYGERMRKIAQTYSMPYVEHFVEWGSLPDLNKLEKELEKDSKIGVVGMVHHETTTGILNPIKQAGKIAKKHNCIFITDTISSFAGIPLNIKDYNIDFMVSTSNKCIQAMPGVSFVIAKKDELEKTKDYPKRSFYLNLYDQHKYFQEKNQMRFTPPVQTIYSLSQAIKELEQEGGVEKRHERYKENCQILVNGMEQLGFKKYKPEVPQSHILTTFWEPSHPNYSFNKMHDSLHEKGFTIYPGKITEETFRLANMGAINSGDIKNFLKAMQETIKEMNLNLK